MHEIRVNQWVLKDKNNKPVKTRTEYESFRYEKYQVVGGTPPHKLGSTGKIWVYRKDSPLSATSEMYPTVFGMRWVVDNSQTINDISKKFRIETDQDPDYPQVKVMRFVAIT